MGNKVDLLVVVPNTNTAMLSTIENAIDHINMETYIFEGDEVGQHAAVLIAKQ